VFDNAKPIPDEIIVNLFESAQVDIRPTIEDIPMPWDAGFSVTEKDFVLEGSVGGHGLGSCRVSIPKEDQSRLYEVEVWAVPEREEAFQAALKSLRELGVQILVV
jgi:hypothetical protein